MIGQSSGKSSFLRSWLVSLIAICVNTSLGRYTSSDLELDVMSSASSDPELDVDRISFLDISLESSSVTCVSPNRMRSVLRSNPVRSDCDYVSSPIRVLYPPCPVREVPLHPDLVNEPYTHYDTGVRADIPDSDRPFFLFKASLDGPCSCRVGQLHFDSPDQGRSCWRSNSRPDYSKYKTSSTVSIIDVYDVYGLEVACSYLRAVYTSRLSLERQDWLSNYLLGSIAVLQPEFASEFCGNHRMTISVPPLTFVSILISLLVSLDAKQPRLAFPLTRHTTTLPPEVLGKIFRSKRICTAITAAVRAKEERGACTLREGEIEALARHPAVQSQGSTCWLHNMEYDGAWSLSRDQYDQEFSLRFQEGRVVLTDEPSDNIIHSIHDYVSIYNRRGLDGKAIVRSELCQARDIAREKPRDRICALIVQLCYDTGYKESDLLFGWEEVLALFVRLIERALASLDTPPPLPLRDRSRSRSAGGVGTRAPTPQLSCTYEEVEEADTEQVMIGRRDVSSSPSSSRYV